MDALFDPPIYRYTLRANGARHEALKERAAQLGMQPGQLMQALFDAVDLTSADGQVAFAKDRFDRLIPRAETTKELAERAASVGLTTRELKVFRALANAAGACRVVSVHPMDISAASRVSVPMLDDVFDRLTAKGWIAEAGRQGRRRFTICRMPDV